MRIDFAPSPELYPFQSRWFESAVGRVHYIDEGQGRPIVFFHGNPTWSFLYRDIIARLRDRYRCLALDYPGFGLSDHPEQGYSYTAAEHCQVATEWWASLGIEDAIVFGQDWGGPVGLGTALNHAGAVTGLAFGNTWFWPADHVLMHGFSWLMSSGPVQNQILENNLFVDRLIPMGTRRHLSDDEMEHYRAVQPTADARVGVAEFPRQIREATDYLGRLARDVPDAFGDRPALLVWGERDPVFPKSRVLPRWKRTFPNHEYVALPTAKHFIQEDEPAVIADAIAARFSAS